MLPCVQTVYRSLSPHDCSSVFQNNNTSIEAVIVNTAKLKDALQPELSVGSADFVGSVDFGGSSVLKNLNSPKFGMGFRPLNAPTVLFVILEMLTCGPVVSLSIENSLPYSVPASSMGVTWWCSNFLFTCRCYTSQWTNAIGGRRQHRDCRHFGKVGGDLDIDSSSHYLWA